MKLVFGKKKKSASTKDAVIKELKKVTQAVGSVIKSQRQALQAKVVKLSHKQSATCETSSTGPHEAVLLEEIVSHSLSFLGLAELAAGARTCRTWSRAAKSETCWLAIACSRWPEWATRLESESKVGMVFDFKSAFVAVCYYRFPAWDGTLLLRESYARAAGIGYVVDNN